MNQNIIQIVRWIARILAALMAALIAFMFVGNAAADGIGPLINLTFRESLMMAAFVVVFVGLILAWKKEKLGGWLVVGGMVLFYLFDFTVFNDFALKDHPVLLFRHKFLFFLKKFRVFSFRYHILSKRIK